MLNRVTLIGNLGQKPELKKTESGVFVATFSMATNENYKDKDGNFQKVTEWHRIVVWRELAERAERQLDKGMQIFLEGKLTTRKYTDREGIERYTTEIVGNTIRILDRRENKPTEPAEAPMAEEGENLPF